MNNIELINLAKQARENARPEITGFKVGAALLCKNGNAFLGCNIEDPSGIGVTNICAERCAIVKALSDGVCEDEFEKIAVVGGKDELVFCSPCGACRQYLQSWCPNIRVVLQDKQNPPMELSMSELLPYSFNL